MSQRNADAIARKERLGLDTPAIVEDAASWDNIPPETILVVECDGRVIGAVTVDTPQGRKLYSKEPCPTCGQDWVRSDLTGEIKILWPEHYKAT